MGMNEVIIMTRKHSTEAQIIDYIDGTLSWKEKNEISNHLQSCAECHELYHFWDQTLHEHVEIPESKIEKHYHSIVSSIKQLKKKQTKRRSWHPFQKGLVFAAVCGFFLLTGIYIGGQNESNYAIQEDEEPMFIMDNETQFYDLVHTSSGINKGYAWYNPVQKEVILYLRDSYEQHPYRAQIETKQTIINEVPIYLRDGKIQFYIQDDQLDELYRLNITNKNNLYDQNSYEFHLIPTVHHLCK